MGSNNPIIQTIYLTGISPMVVFICNGPGVQYLRARAWRLQGPGAWRTPKLAIAGRDLEAGEGRDQRVAGGAVHSACRPMQISWKASWIFVARACRVATHTRAATWRRRNIWTFLILTLIIGSYWIYAHKCWTLALPLALPNKSALH